MIKEKEVNVSERQVMMTIGSDYIWFTKYNDGSLNIGINMNSHCSVSGRWDLELSDEQKIELSKFLS